MSMCESVASTCCYRIVVSPSNYYFEVLNGGTLGQGALPAWIPGVPLEWAKLDFDVDFSEYAGNTLVPYRNNLLEGWWVLSVADGAIVGTSPINDLLGDPDARLTVTNRGCTHGTRTCLYITDGDDGWLHENADEAHVYGGDHLKGPHEAVQFNS